MFDLLIICTNSASSLQFREEVVFRFFTFGPKPKMVYFYPLGNTLFSVATQFLQPFSVFSFLPVFSYQRLQIKAWNSYGWYPNSWSLYVFNLLHMYTLFVFILSIAETLITWCCPCRLACPYTVKLKVCWRVLWRFGTQIMKLYEHKSPHPDTNLVQINHLNNNLLYKTP